MKWKLSVFTLGDNSWETQFSHLLYLRTDGAESDGDWSDQGYSSSAINFLYDQSLHVEGLQVNMHDISVFLPFILQQRISASNICSQHEVIIISWLVTLHASEIPVRT